MPRLRLITALLGFVLAALIAFAPTASAQSGDDTYPLTTTPPTVLDREFENPPQVESNEFAQSDGLPVTGGDVVGLTVIGLVAVGAGFALVRYQRSAAARV